MKKFIVISALALVLGACTVSQNPQAPMYPVVPDQSSSVTSQASSSGSASSQESSPQSVTLVNQSDANVTGSGKELLKEMGVVKVSGHLDSAKLTLALSGSKYDVVGMYFAPLLSAQYDASGNLLQKAGINATAEWKRFKYVDAVWNGSCSHVLSHSAWGLLNGSGETFDLSALPVTTGDTGCSTTGSTVDVLSQLNANGGGYFGFLVNPKTSSVKVTLNYTGSATVTPLN